MRIRFNCSFKFCVFGQEKYIFYSYRKADVERSPLPVEGKKGDAHLLAFQSWSFDSLEVPFTRMFFLLLLLPFFSQAHLIFSSEQTEKHIFFPKKTLRTLHEVVEGRGIRGEERQSGAMGEEESVGVRGKETTIRHWK